MAAEEDELPPDLVESMENLDRSFERCQSVLKSLMKFPLLDSKTKVNIADFFCLFSSSLLPK